MLIVLILCEDKIYRRHCIISIKRCCNFVVCASEWDCKLHLIIWLIIWCSEWWHTIHISIVEKLNMHIAWPNWHFNGKWFIQPTYMCHSNTPMTHHSIHFFFFWNKSFHSLLRHMKNQQQAAMSQLWTSWLLKCNSSKWQNILVIRTTSKLWWNLFF